MDSVRIPTLPCLRAVSRYAVIHTEEVLGKISDLRLDFGPLTEAVLGSDLYVDIFRANCYSSHPEMRASISMPDAHRPVVVLPDASPSPFLSSYASRGCGL